MPLQNLGPPPAPTPLPEPTAATLERAVAAFDRILTRAQAAGPLPDLGGPPKEQAPGLLEWLFNQLVDYLGATGVGKAIRLDYVALAVCAALVLSLLVYLALAISRYLAKRGARVVAPWQGGPGPVQRRDLALQKRFDDAVAAGRFAEALRLRWRLEVAAQRAIKRSASLSETPRERAGPSRAESAQMTEVERAMFGAPEPGRAEFEAARRTLESLQTAAERP